MATPQSVVLSSEDDTRLSITIFQSESNDAPVLVILPAFGVKARYYHHFAQRLATNNISTITTDLREQASTAVTDTDFGFLEMINDLKAVADFVKKEFVWQKVFLLGHSLGGQVASLFTAKYREFVAGLITIGAPNVYYKGWSGFDSFRRKLGVYFLPIISKLLLVLPRFKVAGGYPTSRQVTEWGYTNRTGNYRVVGDDFDYENAMRAVTVRILSIAIEEDQMAPQKAIDNLSCKFENAQRTAMVLTHAQAGQRVSHINWPRTAAALMVKTITEWMSNHPEDQSEH